MTSTSLQNELKHQFSAAQAAQASFRDDPYCSWDEKEAMLLGRPKTRQAKSAKSQVYDPRAATIVMERSARVMAQMPTGKVQAYSEDDKGKNILMNSILNNYVIPNGNTQFDQITKLRLLDMYSLAYGSFGVIVDWHVSESYVGPDISLIPMRSLFLEAGCTNDQTANFVFVSSEQTLGWLKKQRGQWNADNIAHIAAKIGSGAGIQAKKSSPNNSSFVERQNIENINAKNGKGQYANVLLVTRYERNRWVTFAPDYDYIILRDIPSPHCDGELPVVMKHAFPLLDRPYGLGEFERGKTLQYAINSLINLYLDGVKMAIYPPLLLDPNKIVASSIKYQPAAKWLGTKDSIQPFNISPQGAQTFQSTYSFLIAALLNQAGTTDTSTTAQTDPGMGRTPDAIKFLSARESSRDNWDRFQMEKTTERIFTKYANLIANKQEQPIRVEMFNTEIEKIAKIFPDVKDFTKIYSSGDFGHMTVTRDMLVDKKNDSDIYKAQAKEKQIAQKENRKVRKVTKYKVCKYRYTADAGSTMKYDEAKEKQALSEILKLLIKNPNIIEQIKSSGKNIDWGELLKRWFISSGANDWDKILTDSVVEDVESDNGQVVDNQAIITQLEQFKQSDNPEMQEMAQQLEGLIAQNNTPNDNLDE